MTRKCTHAFHWTAGCNMHVSGYREATSEAEAGSLQLGLVKKAATPEKKLNPQTGCTSGYRPLHRASHHFISSHAWQAERREGWPGIVKWTH